MSKKLKKLKPLFYYVHPTYVISISAKRFAISVFVTTSLSKLTNNGAIPAPTPKPNTWVNQIPKSYPHQGRPSGEKRARAWLRCAFFSSFSWSSTRMFRIIRIAYPKFENHCENHSFNIYILFSVVTKRHLLFFLPLPPANLLRIRLRREYNRHIYIYGEISLSARTKADALLTWQQD